MELKQADYHFLSYLGSGAYSDVFCALDPFGNRVAVKQFADHEPIRTLDREYECLIRLNHPNIVQVIDYFREDRTLVMEYIPGITPEDDTRYEPFPWILDIAEAIAYSHSMRIAHRDILACNVRITPKNRGVVIDYGCGTRRPTEQDRLFDMEGIGDLILANCLLDNDLRSIGKAATYKDGITAKEVVRRLREVFGCQPVT